MFTIELRYTGEQVDQDYAYDLSIAAGRQLKIMIGLVQVVIMVELGVQVQLSARKMTPEEAEK